MFVSAALEAHRAEIRAVVLAHRATNPRVLGSAARREDTETSDLDLLVDPTAGTTLLDLGAICDELERLLGAKVDVLTPHALPASFRDRVLAEAAPL